MQSELKVESKRNIWIVRKRIQFISSLGSTFVWNEFSHRTSNILFYWKYVCVSHSFSEVIPLSIANEVETVEKRRNMLRSTVFVIGSLFLITQNVVRIKTFLNLISVIQSLSVSFLYILASHCFVFVQSPKVFFECLILLWHGVCAFHIVGLWQPVMMSLVFLHFA